MTTTFSPRYGMISALCLIGVLAGCATAPTYLYRTDSKAPPHMSVAEARQAFLMTIKQGYVEFFRGREAVYAAVRSAAITSDGNMVRLKQQTREALPFTDGYNLDRFRTDISVETVDREWARSHVDMFEGWIRYWVNCPGLRESMLENGGRFTAFIFKTLEDAKRVADALYVLGHATPQEIIAAGKELAQAEEATFIETVKSYRSLALKPEIPEETHKYSVQAEHAMDQKQYDRAIEFYDKGLEITPCWAHGHFNRALMLAETKQYEEAITAMKKYLALEPNAPDARAAQDKIYQWESDIGSPSTAGHGAAGQ